MSIEALILGKLHEDAKTRTSSTTGRQYVTAKVRVAVSDGESVFVNVIAFSESACTALLALSGGDSLALAGTLKPGAWTDREGNPRSDGEERIKGPSHDRRRQVRFCGGAERPSLFAGSAIRRPFSGPPGRCGACH